MGALDKLRRQESMGLGREQENGRHNWSGLVRYAWKPVFATVDFTLSEMGMSKEQSKGLAWGWGTVDTEKRSSWI